MYGLCFEATFVFELVKFVLRQPRVCALHSKATILWIVQGMEPVIEMAPMVDVTWRPIILHTTTCMS